VGDNRAGDFSGAASGVVVSNPASRGRQPPDKANWPFDAPNPEFHKTKFRADADTAREPDLMIPREHRTLNIEPMPAARIRSMFDVGRSMFSIRERCGFNEVCHFPVSTDHPPILRPARLVLSGRANYHERRGDNPRHASDSRRSFRCQLRLIASGRLQGSLDRFAAAPSWRQLFSSLWWS
jgi:hypothetical protein